MTPPTGPFSAVTPSPGQAAAASARDYRVRPTTLVTYASSGALLVIGGAADVADVWPRLAHFPPRALLLTDRCTPALHEGLRDAAIPYRDRCDEISVRGYLGAFRVEARPGGETAGAPSLPEDGFDLVLDLRRPPCHTAQIPPVGYFAPAGDPRRLAAALAQLPEMVGEFDKPKFFHFEPDLCAHAANGVQGCSRCLEACATEAITSEQGAIGVNPYLCQGCGDCATVCPSGAMNYAFPYRADSLDRIRAMLKAFREAGGASPVLLLHDSAAGKRWVDARHDLPDHLIPYEIEAAGAAGVDLWLAAIAYGTASMLILEAEAFTGRTEASLAVQLTYARELLSGLGLPQRIAVVRPAARFGENDLPPSHAPAVPPADFAGQADKRTVIRLAVDHLAAHAPRVPEWVALSPGAPFGAITVDTERCTLCMACVAVCPASALADGKTHPRLQFIEANCVQCGLCVNGCPEDAVALLPRYRYDSVAARRPVVLHEEAPFQCIGCGKPFASQSMIRTIMARLEHHPMFQGEARARLKMCDECRIKAIF